MRFRNDYMYYRECYSDRYFITELRFYVKLNNGTNLYIGFDKDNNISFSEEIEKAAVFLRYPRDYDTFEKKIKRKFPNSSLNCLEKVVERSKYLDYYH